MPRPTSPKTTARAADRAASAERMARAVAEVLPPMPDRCEIADAVVARIAQFLARERSTRIRAGLRPRQRAGLPTGAHVRYGYRVGTDGHVVEDADEQRAIKRILELRASGATLYAVAQTLEREGHKPRPRRASEAAPKDATRPPKLVWHIATIQRIIKDNAAGLAIDGRARAARTRKPTAPASKE